MRNIKAHRCSRSPDVCRGAGPPCCRPPRSCTPRSSRTLASDFVLLLIYIGVSHLPGSLRHLSAPTSSCSHPQPMWVVWPHSIWTNQSSVLWRSAPITAHLGDQHRARLRVVRHGEVVHDARADRPKQGHIMKSRLSSWFTGSHSLNSVTINVNAYCQVFQLS